MDLKEKKEINGKISQLRILLTKSFISEDQKSKYRSMIKDFQKKLGKKGD